MRNAMFGLLVATVGVVVARIGQGVMAIQYDPYWAFLAVASLLGGFTIAMSAPLERALARVSDRRR